MEKVSDVRYVDITFEIFLNIRVSGIRNYDGLSIGKGTFAIRKR